MKKFCIALIILTSFSFCKQGKVIKTPFNNLPSTFGVTTKKQSQQIFNSLQVFPNETQFSIAIIKNGKANFIGVKRKNDTISKTKNHQKVFEIGSITKLFTSAILANFVMDHKLKLNDPINDFIKTPFKDNIKISFKQLANHTSGLPKMPSNLVYSDKLNKFKEYNTEKLKEYLKEEIELSSVPGEKSSYSNIGIGILGYTLSKASNNNYSQLLNKYIFSKYNMEKTSINRESINTHLIKGLNIHGNQTPNWDLAALSPAGGILSTVEDLSKFAIAQFNPLNKDLALTQQETFQINKNTSQALGWRIENNSTNKWHCHNGRTGGYTSSICLDIQNQKGVIILSNISTIGNKNKKYITNLSSVLLKSL